MGWTDEGSGAYGEEAYGGAGYAYAPGGGGTATEWDSPHGDVITVLPPDQVLPANDPVRPVFVDASGRRQHRVRRIARLLVIPAGGYVALLISTLLGGPTISAPFVPLPDTTHPATPRATAPDSGSGSSSGTGQAAGSNGSGAAYGSSRPTARRTTPGPDGSPTASTAPAAASGTTATPTGTASPTATAAATAAPTAAHSAKGRANASSHKPVK